jgi:hypothetical protein
MTPVPPYPSTEDLATLAPSAARPYEALWLGWARVLAVEGLVRAAPAQDTLPDWLNELPAEIVAPARLGVALASRRPVDEERMFNWFLAEPDERTLYRLNLPAPETLPRECADGSLPDYASLQSALAQGGGSTLIPPLDAAGNLRPERVLSVSPRWLGLLLSVGAQVRLWPLGFRPWRLGSAEALILPRERLATLLRQLAPPPAAEWALAWNAARRKRGLTAPLASPYEVTAQGPVIPVKPPPEQQPLLTDLWLLAGSGLFRALARVVPLA